MIYKRIILLPLLLITACGIILTSLSFLLYLNLRQNHEAMKTKLYYSFLCALIIILSACSSKLNTSSSSSVKEKTLMDLMKEKIKGFNVGMWPSSNPPRAGLTGGRAGLSSVPFMRKMSYKILDKELHLIIDGQNIERFYVPDGESTGNYVSDRNKAPMRDRMQFIETYLMNIKAEDVTSLEIISDSKYKEKYKPASAYQIDGSLSVANAEFAYVEVTTSSGNGAFRK